MKIRKTRREIFVAGIVLAMLTAGSQADLTISSNTLDVWGSDARTNRGRVAVKSTNEPVISVGTFHSPAKYYVREGAGNWNSRSGGWVTGGASSADLTVDSSDNYHFVYGKGGTNPPTYVSSGGGRTNLSSNKWSSGAGSVQIVANDDGISVGYHPRTPEWQSEYWSYTSTDGGATFPATPTEVDHLSNNLSPRFLASADEHYYFSLPTSGYSSPGPFWQQADDGSDADVQSLSTGASPGTKSGSGYYYDFYLAPAWNGSDMNLASIEGPGTGEVSLYLDLEGTPSQVSVYSGTDAGSVALAAFGGTNYVFYTAEGPSGTDHEIFVRPVAQDGTLGAIQQLTDDDYHQLELDIAGWDGGSNPNFHLTYTSYVGGIWDDATERVGYMHLTPEPATLSLLLLGGLGLVRRRR